MKLNSASQIGSHIEREIYPGVMKTKDRIFQINRKAADFEFDQNVANVFNDMLLRSIPFYTEIQRMIGEMAHFFYQPKTCIFDLGCSTGNSLKTLVQSVTDRDAIFIGIDNSEPMLERAGQYLKKEAGKAKIRLVLADLAGKDFSIENASVVIMNWTLQFIRPIYREQLLRKIAKGTNKGGVLILCEKVLVDQSVLNRLYIDLYYDFKKRNGYSTLEIAQKREALENVLIPNKIQEDIDLLRLAGYSDLEVFFRWYNWAGLIAIK